MNQLRWTYGWLVSKMVSVGVIDLCWGSGLLVLQYNTCTHVALSFLAWTYGCLVSRMHSTVRLICHCGIYNSGTEVGASDLVSTGLAINSTQWCNIFSAHAWTYRPNWINLCWGSGPLVLQYMCIICLNHMLGNLIPKINTGTLASFYF